MIEAKTVIKALVVAMHIEVRELASLHFIMQIIGSYFELSAGKPADWLLRNLFQAPVMERLTSESVAHYLEISCILFVH